MSFLLSKMNEVNDTFRKVGSFSSDLGTFTGFTAIDILSSNYEHLPNLEVEVLNGGMFNNPYNEIGLSAVGKTTLWIQAISGCMDNWYKWYGPVAECIFYNVENHTSPRRWMDITGYSEDMMRERVRFVSKSLSIVEIYNELAVVAKQKLEYRKQLEVDTGITSLDGGTIKILPTTYVLIDSIAAVRTKTELVFDKEGNIKDGNTIAGTTNMDAMRIAKDNTMFINEAKKICEDAKMCIVMINHLVEVPVLDRYNPPKPILPSMKFNQKLKGGNELIYQSFGVNMLSIRERLFNEKSKIYGDSVHGLIAFMEWLKNKNGPEGIKYPMVFDSASGYKPELSDFELLYTSEAYGISGSPARYYLDILPEITFTRKTLLQTCYDNPLLARAMSFTTRLYLIRIVVDHAKPLNIKEYSSLPYEARVSLILRYSMDYPGYINYGRVVSQEDEDYYRTVVETLELTERPTIVATEGELEFVKMTNGDFSFTDNINVVGNEVFTIGETEYVTPLGQTTWKTK